MISIHVSLKIDVKNQSYWENINCSLINYLISKWQVEPNPIIHNITEGWSSNEIACEKVSIWDRDFKEKSPEEDQQSFLERMNRYSEELKNDILLFEKEQGINGEIEIELYPEVNS